jgi:hypothetical protein
VKYWQISLPILAVLSASLALADDFKTIDGKEYKNAKVNRVEPDGIVITHSAGVAKIPFRELPKDVQERFGYDSAKIEGERAAARAGEEKRIEKQKAGREEREQNVAANLTKAEEQFQTAEMRAAHAYEGSGKGTLSGQVFVATKGGQSTKLGAVGVSLFSRDAIDDVFAGLNAFTSAKTKQLKIDLSVARAREQQASTVEKQAKAAKEQADATERSHRELYEGSGHSLSDGARAVMISAKQDVTNATAALNTARETATTARGEVQRLLAEQAYYHSHAFYFSHLWKPIQTAETDGDGKFAIQVPSNGEFVIAAQAERSVGNETESYYWLQPVSLGGQRESVQNLSNSNVMVIPYH